MLVHSRLDFWWYKTLTMFSAVNYDSSWSLNPLIKCLQVLAIDLNASTPRLSLRCVYFIVMELSLLTWTAYATYVNVKQGAEDDTLVGVMKWHRIISFFSYGFANFSMQLATIYASHFNWKTLWKSLKELERAVHLDEWQYKKLRKLSFMAVFSVIVVFPLL